jgi:predicted CopG family antitoxin
MKTISLTEEAYQRLQTWKSGSAESFSKVVLRLVPPKYTGAAILEAARGIPPLSGEQADRMEEALAEANDWSKVQQPWTS